MEYRMIQVSVTSEDNVIDIIKADVELEGKKYPDFKLKFVGFEAEPGTKFSINNNDFQVPTNGKFITPYNGTAYWNIKSLFFTEGCSAQNIYYII